MNREKDNLHEAYLLYVEKPETKKTGECQKVDGRGWSDEKASASNSASLYVDNVSGIHCTKYHPCD